MGGGVLGGEGCGGTYGSEGVLQEVAGDAKPGSTSDVDMHSTRARQAGREWQVTKTHSAKVVIGPTHPDTVDVAVTVAQKPVCCMKPPAGAGLK